MEEKNYSNENIEETAIEETITLNDIDFNNINHLRALVAFLLDELEKVNNERTEEISSQLVEALNK